MKWRVYYSGWQGASGREEYASRPAKWDFKCFPLPRGFSTAENRLIYLKELPKKKLTYEINQNEAAHEKTNQDSLCLALSR